MTDRQRHGFILLLVAGLIAASVVVLLSMKTVLGLDLKGGVELVYKGEPTAQSAVTPAALGRAVDVMRNRVDQLGVSEPEIQTYGGNEISVGLPNVHDTARAIAEVGTTARREYAVIGDRLPFMGGRPREEIEALLRAHGLVDIGSDPVLDLVEAQAQRMVEEGRERQTRVRYVAWGEVAR